MPDKRYQQQVIREEVKTIRSQHRCLEFPVTGQCVELVEPMNTVVAIMAAIPAAFRLEKCTYYFVCRQDVELQLTKTRQSNDDDN